MLSCITLFTITEMFNLLFLPSLLFYLLPTLPVIFLTTSITVNGNLWKKIIDFKLIERGQGGGDRRGGKKGNLKRQILEI